MAKLLHSTVRFITPTLTGDTGHSSSTDSQLISNDGAAALITSNLLNPVSADFAALIESCLQSNEQALSVLIEEAAIAANPALIANVDEYFSAHPSLNYASRTNIESLTSRSLDLTSDTLLLVFGSHGFINDAMQQSLPMIGIATRTQNQTIHDIDLLARSLLDNAGTSCLKASCFDSRLLISDQQGDRASWVIRGIQHALFHDSQMYHWIEGNLYQLLTNDRCAINHLFLKVADQMLDPAEQLGPESFLQDLFIDLWQKEMATLNMSLSGYAQAMTTTLLLCIRYAVELQTLEEGIDARVLHLLKQIAWIAPGSARRLQPSQSMRELPQLLSIGQYEIRKLNKPAMWAAERWLSKEAERLNRAA